MMDVREIGTPVTTPRRWVLAVLCGLLAGGFVLRLIGLRYGLPAVYNPDEVAIMSRALAFAKGDLNPHNFLYPTLYFYVLFAWEGLAATIAVATRAVASFGAFQREFFLDPTRVYEAGRLLTAIAGTATIAATWRLARRWQAPLGVIAAAEVIAFSPLHVRDSHYVKHDVPAALLITCAFLAYSRLWSASAPCPTRRRDLLIAAAVTGAAFSTHYYTIFLAIPLAWAVLRSSTRRERVRDLVVAGLVSASVFFLCSPFILTNLPLALRDIQANRQIVVDRAVGSLGYLETLRRYLVMLATVAVGWPFSILAAAGVAIGWRRDRLRTLWLLSFCLPFFVFIAGTYPASRYLIPLVPFLAIFAGEAVSRSAEMSRVLPVLLMATGFLPLERAVDTDRFIRQTDTRTLARHFIERGVPDGTTILVQPYSVPLEPTAGSLREAVRRAAQPMPVKTALEIARQPYPVPAYRLIYIGRGLDVDKIYLPVDALDRTDPFEALRKEHVAFVVLKRYNEMDPALLPFLTALDRQGRRIAVFSPYRDGGGDRPGRPEPFLHNTDARIDPSLERPGPVMEIWQIDGPRP